MILLKKFFLDLHLFLAKNKTIDIHPVHTVFTITHLDPSIGNSRNTRTVQYSLTPHFFPPTDFLLLRLLISSFLETASNRTQCC